MIHLRPFAAAHDRMELHRSNRALRQSRCTRSIQPQSNQDRSHDRSRLDPYRIRTGVRGPSPPFRLGGVKARVARVEGRELHSQSPVLAPPRYRLIERREIVLLLIINLPHQRPGPDVNFRSRSYVSRISLDNRYCVHERDSWSLINRRASNREALRVNARSRTR
jgi:hypothetical protein